MLLVLARIIDCRGNEIFDFSLASVQVVCAFSLVPDLVVDLDVNPVACGDDEAGITPLRPALQTARQGAVLVDCLLVIVCLHKIRFGIVVWVRPLNPIRIADSV